MSSSIAPGTLYVVSAPSGAGKTSLTHALIARLVKQGISVAFSVSYTTRVPRPGERDGVDYHFVDSAAFDAMIAGGEFLEHARVFDRCYGTGRAATEALLTAGQDVILDIDWQGARQVREHVADAVSIFILPPSREELARRLRLRAQDDEAVIATRLRTAADEIAHYSEYDYLVVNDEFEHACAALESILLARRLRRDVQEPRLRRLLAEWA